MRSVRTSNRLAPWILSIALCGSAGCAAPVERQLGPNHFTLDGEVCTPDGYCGQDPSRRTKEIHDIWGSALGDVYAVGLVGTVLHHDGKHWTLLDVGTSRPINAVWGTGPSDVFVGGSNVLLHFDGQSWTHHEIPDKVNLRALWGSGPQDVFAVGKDGVILHYDGQAWTAQDSGTKAILQDVWGSGPQDVFVVGNRGTILHYDGKQWTEQRKTRAGDQILSVWGSGPGDVFAIGNQKYVLHFDGASWSEQPRGGGVCLYHALWGNGPTEVYAAGNDGLMMRYDGTAWQLLDKRTEKNLYALWSSEGRWFAMGASGVLINSDGAQHLAAPTRPKPDATTQAAAKPAKSAAAPEPEPTRTPPQPTRTEPRPVIAGTCHLIDLRRGHDGGYYSYPDPQAKKHRAAPASGIGSLFSVGGLNLPGQPRCIWPFDPKPVQDHIDSLLACLRTTGTPPSGRLTLEAVATSQGTVQRARVVGGGEQLDACVAEVLRGIRFPLSPMEAELLEAQQESAEYAQREMGETIPVSAPSQRPIICTLLVQVPRPTPSVKLEITGDQVLIDGRPLAETAQLAGSDALAAVRKIRVPQHGKHWSLALRARADTDQGLVNLVLSYLKPSTVFFARPNPTAATVVPYDIVNPRGTPDRRFCTIVEPSVKLNFTHAGIGIDINAGEKSAFVRRSGNPLQYNHAALGQKLDELKQGVLEHRSDLVIELGDATYADLVLALGAARLAGFHDIGYWANGYDEMQQYEGLEGE